MSPHWLLFIIKQMQGFQRLGYYWIFKASMQEYVCNMKICLLVVNYKTHNSQPPSLPLTLELNMTKPVFAWLLRLAYI